MGSVVVAAVAVKATPDTKAGLVLNRHGDGSIKVVGVSPDGIFAGSDLKPGMNIVSINNQQMFGRSLEVVAKIIKSIQGNVYIVAEKATSPALLLGEEQNENAPSPPSSVAPKLQMKSTSPTAATAFASASPLPSVNVLIEMSNKQLEEELDKRGLSLKGKPTKDMMLDRLGIPALQWKKWRKINIAELNVELRKRHLTVRGTKHELLLRLGVPPGFGETTRDKTLRELNENMKRKRQAVQQSRKKLKTVLNSTEDPTHEDYVEKCCNAPRWGHSTQPTGCIQHRDGGITEVYRCLACGKFPAHPNAPPIEEYPSDDDEAADFVAFLGAYSNLGGENPDCIVQ